MAGPKDQPMPAAEHAALRGWLAGKGLSAGQIAVAVGNAPGGRSRHDVERSLAAWLRQLPKG